jgi:hypothetical protein
VDLGWNRIIGINRIARMDEEIRLQAPHRFINAHASDRGIDSKTLPHGIAGP